MPRTKPYSTYDRELRERIFSLGGEGSLHSKAVKLGIKATTLNNWMQEKSRPTIAQLKKIVFSTKCSWTFLMTGWEDNNEGEFNALAKEVINLRREISDLKSQNATLESRAKKMEAFNESLQEEKLELREKIASFTRGASAG